MALLRELYSWQGGILVFLFWGVILVACILYAGTKLMNYFEKRSREIQERKRELS
jgi:hypothetical protein